MEWIAVSFRLLTQPLALGGVVATDVATVGELDGDVVEGAGEGEWRRVPVRHSRSVVLADADEVCHVCFWISAGDPVPVKTTSVSRVRPFVSGSAGDEMSGLVKEVSHWIDHSNIFS